MSDRKAFEQWMRDVHLCGPDDLQWIESRNCYESHRIQLAWHMWRDAQAQPVCKCDLRTKLVGDGCAVCNPELAGKASQAQPTPQHPPTVDELDGGTISLLAKVQSYWARRVLKLPLAWIVEGTSSLQCLCPTCEYGKGYNEPLLYGCGVERVRTCKTCGTAFIALTMETADTKLTEGR